MTDHSVPPTHADLLDEDISPRPAWPKVIGIISITLSSLAIFCGVAGSAMEAMGMSGGPPGSPPPPPMPMIMYVYAGLNVILNVILLTAGVMTTLRKPAGRPVHLLHAGLKIPLTIWGIIISLNMQAARQEWTEQVMGAEAAAMTAMIGLIMMAVFSIVSFGWPIFLLVWFGLVKRRNSDITIGVDELVA